MKRVISLLLLAVMLLSVLPTVAFAAEEEAPTPFAYCNAVLQTERLTMSGKTYDDAILFSMGYTGLSSTANMAEVTYNFKGQYKSLTFDAGYVSGAERNASLTVTADEKVILEVASISYVDIAKEYTVSLEGVSKLTIRFNSNGYDKAKYAIGNVKAVPVSGAPSEKTLESDPSYDDCQYFLQRASVLTETFSMGGYRYRNGYKMVMGYNGTSQGYTGIVAYNFGGEYKKLSFDIAKYMNRINESYIRSAYLTIEVDGKILEEYDGLEMKWNDIPLHVELDLTDVTQVVISVHSDGYDTVNWAMGNIQLQDKHTHVTVAGKAATCTEPGLTDGEKCSECGKVFVEQEQIPATGHTEVKDAAVEATCGKAGKTEGSHCSVCNTVIVKQQTVPATGKHTYSNDQDTKCDVCGYVRTVEEETVPVYRLYNPYTYEHLLTTGKNEMELLISIGWSLDGIAWEAPTSGVSVYRLYNPYDDWHTYTISESERDTMVRAGWTVDGVVSFGAIKATDRPIYRLFNPYVQTNYHLFTAGVEERELLVNAGWILEGTAWYAAK